MCPQGDYSLSHRLLFVDIYKSPFSTQFQFEGHVYFENRIATEGSINLFEKQIENFISRLCPIYEHPRNIQIEVHINILQPSCILFYAVSWLLRSKYFH